VVLGWIVTTVVAEELFVTTSYQSVSFVYPVGKTIEYITSGFESMSLSFALLSMIGVVVGGFISTKTNKLYSTKMMCDNGYLNPPKLWMKLIGGAMMGVGGILAIGCTVGQGLSGVSSLSLASVVAIASIYLSAFITARFMKKRDALVACFIFDWKDSSQK
jgi:hypothetical protein